jgi:hypothetical protein
MHDIPRKDREDADDVDEEEVSEVSGGNVMDGDGCIPPFEKNYPDNPGRIVDPLVLNDDPYLER